MWLSEVKVRKNEEEASCYGTVTIGGDAPGIYTQSEERDFAVCSAGGFIWRPKAGDKVLVIKTGDGEAVAAGVVNQRGAADMKNGEVYIRSENASVFVRNDGSIEISGDVNIRGSLKINGNEIS